MTEEQWWVYLNDEVHGPFSPRKLADLEQLQPTTQVCPDGTEDWTPLNEQSELVTTLQQIRQEPSDPQETDPSGETSDLQQPAQTAERSSPSDAEGLSTTAGTGESPNPTVVVDDPPGDMDPDSLRETTGDDTWYFKIGNKKSDPFTLDELQSLASLRANTPVRRDSEADWQPAGDVPELADHVDDSPASETKTSGGGSGSRTWILLGVLVIVLLVYLFLDVL